MKFRCDQSLLRDAVGITARAASVKSGNEIFRGILIEAGAEKVRFTGYDLKKGIYTDIDADVERQGSVVVTARMMDSICRLLPEGTATVEITEGEIVKITCGKSEYTIAGMNYEEYPDLPSVEGNNCIVFSQKLLKSLISQTVFAAATDEMRPIYTGILFELDGENLTVVGVDGYRLALRREKITSDKKESVVIPAESLREAEKLCEDDEEKKVKIYLDRKHVSFMFEHTVLITRRLEGDFLNYRKTIPESTAKSVILQRSDLQRSVERVSIVIDDKLKNPLRCSFENGGIDISCQTPAGKCQDICPCEGDGGGVLIGFNNSYLLDALKAAPADELKVGFSISTAPCIITDAAAEPGNEKFVYMVLPVRLKAGA